MSDISGAFKNGKAFIPYIMAGDPNLEKTREYILAMEEAGADLVEIGIPFSDPIAEGEIIQRANVRAFASNTQLDDIFDMVKSLKEIIKIPIVFMTYINPVFNYGYDDFFKKCLECGISGIIVPDLPFEEQDEILEESKRYDIELITLVAPTSKDRIKSIAKAAQGFVYLVSSMGVTGVRSEITTDIPSMISEIKKYTDIPVAVGFGIHTPEQARVISVHADGVIVGSAIENIIEGYGENAGQYLYDYVKDMKVAIM